MIGPILWTILLSLETPFLLAQNHNPGSSIHGRNSQTSGKALTIFEHGCPGKTKVGALRKEDLTVFGVTVGSSTVRDVQARFGNIVPVKLTSGDEAEEGICIRNRSGSTAVFVTDVMGVPDTITAIYLAPTNLIKDVPLNCRQVDLPSTAFSSRSGIHLGTSSKRLSEDLLRQQLPTNGVFCVSLEIESSKGPIEHGKRSGGHAYTGANGSMRAGRLEWIKVFGVNSD